MRALLAIIVLCTPAFAAPVPKELRKKTYEGSWKIVFANGVVETCWFGKNGKSGVEEPLRKAGGQAEEGSTGVIVIAFDDDRTERWTPDGKRYVVEHWFPSSQYPNSIANLGIAERIR